MQDEAGIKWRRKRDATFLRKNRDLRRHSAARMVVDELLRRHNLERLHDDTEGLTHAFQCYTAGVSHRRSADSALGPQKEAHRALGRALKHVDKLTKLQNNPRRVDRQRTQIAIHTSKLADALSTNPYLAVKLALRGLDWSATIAKLGSGNSLASDTLQYLRDIIQAELSTGKGNPGRNRHISRRRFLKTLLDIYERITGSAPAYNWSSSGPDGAFLMFATDAFKTAGTPLSDAALLQAIYDVKHSFPSNSAPFLIP